ncbi:hypothetical protein J2805_003368 [Arthrobacter oryzae]|nr:hypothetical protein [Arthrobacter oryzae]
MQENQHRLIVSVETRNELDAALNSAENLLRPVATEQRVGISITRLAPNRYEASLDHYVPAGTTVENRAK